MDLKNLRSYFFEQLKQSYSREEIQVFFVYLTEKYLGLDKASILLHFERNITTKEQHTFQKAIQRLIENEPIQYIIGETGFLNIHLKVNYKVLIPRPETEEIVEKVIQEIKKESTDKSIKILDIGTGSGAIAISLAVKLPHANVFALDVSKEALGIAQENAMAQQVEIGFIHANVLKLEALGQAYDVIISNPPYVRNSEKKQMHTNVLQYEPAQALFVTDEDPLIFYRKIGQLAYQHLNKNGVLYFEINEFLAKKTKDLLKEIGFQNIALYKDFRGKDRMIKVSL